MAVVVPPAEDEAFVTLAWPAGAAWASASADGAAPGGADEAKYAQDGRGSNSIVALLVAGLAVLAVINRDQVQRWVKQLQDAQNKPAAPAASATAAGPTDHSDFLPAALLQQQAKARSPKANR